MRSMPVLFVAAALSACVRADAPASIDTLQPGSKIGGPAGNATIKFVAIEGGCWTIVRDGSTQNYLPTDLPQAFKVDGKRVNVTFHEVQAASTCMVGPVVNIDQISAAP
jgi:hypothetical protein